MGSGAVDVEAKRRTLLDVISSQVDKSYDDVVTRVTYAAKFLSTCNAAAAAQFFDKHRELVTKACGRTDDSTDDVTGFVLVFPSCAAVQLEAKQATLDTVLAEVISHFQDLKLSQARIISSTDDIPSRAHAALSTAFVPEDAKSPVEEVEIHVGVTEASDINLKFIAFGQEMKSLRGPELQTALGHISTYWEGMPKADKVLCLLQCEFAPTMQAYLDMFTAPINLDLESERIWPVPRLPALKGG